MLKRNDVTDSMCGRRRRGISATRAAAPEEEQQRHRDDSDSGRRRIAVPSGKMLPVTSIQYMRARKRLIRPSLWG
jgi:hypothetical protein